MSKLWVVNRVQGAGWDNAKKPMEQDDWDAHAKLVDGMHADGFVVLAGPLVTTPFEAMLVVRAETEDDVRARFAPDPWVVKDVTRIVRVARWHVRLGSI
jgi:uncharacterized protein YciI